MIVIGREPLVLALVADRLSALDARVRPPTEDLIDSVWRHGDEAIVVVDSLDRRGAPPPDSPQIDWQEVMRAARAPSHPRVVYVGPETADLAELRRSGVGYTLVRTGRFITAQELGLGPIEGKTVRVERDLPVPEIGLTTLADLTSAIEAAVTTDRVGHAFDARQFSWADVIEVLGGRAKTVGPMMARGMRWMGQPVLVSREETSQPPVVWVGGFGDAGIALPMPIPSTEEGHAR